MQHVQQSGATPSEEPAQQRQQPQAGRDAGADLLSMLHEQSSTLHGQTQSQQLQQQHQQQQALLQRRIQQRSLLQQHQAQQQNAEQRIKEHLLDQQAQQVRQCVLVIFAQDVVLGGSR